ncbi:unnamed protein product [Allacma fusca]|uniref:Uncharacterized protein n=1 Tax=Allacma fusca TaxID=39272 RepID=A0A8J2J1W4_9HEXA|nr:unnamed protein product [Allacma fusca]
MVKTIDELLQDCFPSIFTQETKSLQSPYYPIPSKPAQRKRKHSAGKKPKECAFQNSSVPTITYDSYNVTKSPMDKNCYKVIRFPNRLSACLISQLDYIPHDSLECIDPSTFCFTEVQDFNENIVQMHQNIGTDPDDMSLLERATSYLWYQSVDEISDDDPPDDDVAEPALKKLKYEPQPRNEKDPCIDTNFGISICVTVGSLNDPKEFAGMAHLCEHCIFEGTRTYPNSWNLLQENTLHVNAYTGKERTVYYAHTETLKELRTVASIFADMIMHPLLTDEIINREILSIDSESSMRQSNDIIRLFDLFTFLAKTSHPLRRYHAGDASTLSKPKVCETLRKWHQKYYQPHNIIVSIQGPISVPDLINLAGEYFYSLSATRCPKYPSTEIRSFGFPFQCATYNKIYKVCPYEDIQWLVVSWTMPQDIWRNHATKPLEELKIQSIGPKRRIFDEIRMKNAFKFHFENEALNFATTGVSLHINEDSPTCILTAPALVTKYDPQVIRDCLMHLRPDNMNIMIMSKKFQKQVVQLHPNILTEFGAFNISDELLRSLESCHDFHGNFHIPKVNRYITTDFCRPLENSVGNLSVLFCLSYLHSTGKACLVSTHETAQPGYPDMAIYTFMITSSLFPSSNPENSVYSKLWAKILMEKITARYYDAIDAGLRLGVSVAENGLFMHLFGLSRFLPDIWLKMLDDFWNFEVDRQMFEDFTELEIKCYGNNSLSPMTLAQDLVMYITSTRHLLQGSLQLYMQTIHKKIQGQNVDLFPALRNLGEKCFRVKSMSSKCYTSFVINYYQLGNSSREEVATCHLIAQELSSFIFDELRAKQQIGYLVWTVFDESYSVSSLKVCIQFQADRYTPGYVNEKIDEAFADFYEKHIKRDIDLKKVLKKRCTTTTVKRFGKKDGTIQPGETFRKLSVQVVGSKRNASSCPKEAEFEDIKVKRYDSGEPKQEPANSNLEFLTLDTPKNLTSENGYFLTNLLVFRNQLFLYPNCGSTTS